MEKGASTVAAEIRASSTRASRRRYVGVALWAVAFLQGLSAQPAEISGSVVLLATQGKVEVMRARSARWDVAATNVEQRVLDPDDQLRTGRDSQATVRLADQTVMQVGPQSHLRVLQPLPRETSLWVLFGRFFFLHRDDPGRVRVRTPTVTAAIEGTEFSLQVAEAEGTTRLDLFDGRVVVTNAVGHLSLTSGQAAIARAGAPPMATAMIAAVNVIQWHLYYPAVLNVQELHLRDDVRALLQESLAAYERGNLPGASALYPGGRAPDSAEEKVYLAAVRLGVGHTDEALNLIDSATLGATEQTARLVSALRLLIAAVKFEGRPSTRPDQHSISTEWLAESYYEQSRSNLEAARDAAEKAVAAAPGFAFALTRLAELEFSFGRIAPTRDLLAHSLTLGQENAQAVTLQGFFLAARNQMSAALEAFDRALALDPGLANAWLGRGLSRIRRGEIAEGREDLLVAAATEPQRAVLRSYLGKAFMADGNHALARRELGLAKQMDLNDPTAWLYSALLNQLDNRVNAAVRDLERSQSLNDNRSVYRSRELLDQDRAVRGVNLANIYQDSTLTAVAFREAVRAVHDDYASFSTHLFLANSFNRLRDPRQFNLRYESPWLSEYLVANLLAPVGGGTLSQLVSSEEYSRLFERNRIGLVSTTEYLSNGDWLQAAAQHGRLNNIGYAIEEAYRSQNGSWPNGDSERLTVSAQVKVQLSPQDDVFLQSIYYDAEGGDLAQHYSRADVNPGVRFKETQEPLLIAGYHHAWTPFSHTLLMGARLQDSLQLTNPLQSVIDLDLNVAPGGAGRFPLPLHYESELEIYTAELQHIWQWQNYSTILGARYQIGEFDTTNAMPEVFLGVPLIPATARRVETDLERTTLYGYQHWKPFASVHLIGGLSYDHIRFPENFRSPPISDGHETKEQFSPKAGLIWSIASNTTARAAYTRSLGGVSMDQSFQLEPAQVAGFVQTFRSLLPESVRGSAAASRHQTFGVALDQKFPTHTYLGASAEWLESRGTRQVGVFRYGPLPTPFPAVPSVTPEELKFRERSAQLSLHQLLGEEWACGLVYRVSAADLLDRFSELPSDIAALPPFVRRQHIEATLHQIYIQAAWNSPTGVFVSFDAIYSDQSSEGYSPERPGDQFWQFNLFSGYRFLRRRAEVSVGVLNLADQDYHLDPLNLTPELPRERTLAIRLRLSF
jgi:tetratricopeptide (TPR) repeat protein